MTILPLTVLCVTLLAGLVVVVRALLAHDRYRAQLQREIAMHERAAAAPVAELAAAVQALTAAAAALRGAAGRPAPTRLGCRVTVHTKRPDDQTFFGVVVGDYTDRLCLDDAEYVTAGGARQLPGRQDIDACDIAWVDVHGEVTVPSAAPAETE